MLKNTLLFIQLGLFLPTPPSSQGLAGDTRALFRREYTVNLTAQSLGLYSWGGGWRRPSDRHGPQPKSPLVAGPTLQPVPPRAPWPLPCGSYHKTAYS